MSYISAFFLIPSTIILISNLLIIIYEGFSKPSFYFENSVLDTGFLTTFFLSHLARWLGIFFSVPFRDQGAITLIGKGVIAGLITLPFAFTHLFLDGRTASAVMLLCGWGGLLIQVLPDLHHSWRRWAPKIGFTVAALILPVLSNPLIWSSSRLLPVPETAWGTYYPDYDRERGKEFIEHYQRHEGQFN